jgi:hypothetical protein
VGKNFVVIFYPIFYPNIHPINFLPNKHFTPPNFFLAFFATNQLVSPQLYLFHPCSHAMGKNCRQYQVKIVKFRKNIYPCSCGSQQPP